MENSMTAQIFQPSQHPVPYEEAQTWLDFSAHDVIEISSDEEEPRPPHHTWTDEGNYLRHEPNRYDTKATIAPTNLEPRDELNGRVTDNHLSRAQSHQHGVKRRKTSSSYEPNERTEVDLEEVEPHLVDHGDSDDCLIVEERRKLPRVIHHTENGIKPTTSIRSTSPSQINTSETIKPKQDARQPSKFLHLRKEVTRNGGHRSRIAPYYDDPKLGVRMYCGPGYERFPVVLGSNPEHVMICNRWDKRAAIRAQSRQRQQSAQDELGAYVNESLFIDPDEPDTDKDEDLNEREEDCLTQVLEVLPDVSLRFALETIRSLIRYTDDLEEHPSANDVVEAIVYQGQYPKQRPLDAPDDGTGQTIQRAQTNGKTSAHVLDAVALLAEEFGHVPTHHIVKVAQSSESLYSAYITIHKLEESYTTQATKDKPYRRRRTVRTQLEKKYTADGIARRDLARWTEMINDIQAAKQTIAREQICCKKEQAKEAEEAANMQEHIQKGWIVECQCCFDDETPNNRTVSCTGEAHHQYCYGCVTRLASDRIGSMKYEMLCMSSCGCTAALRNDQLRTVIPAKVMEKLDYYQQQAEIEAAGIEGLEQCPLCDFKGICEPVEVDPVFGCQNPDCNRMTCRLCGEQAHVPKTCEQVKKEKGISQARHLIEEARSAAMMRTCAKCKKKLIKESGCNKMRCQCGTLLCYVCQKDITKEGYSHFSKQPGACPQGDDPHFDRHEHEADEAERKAIRDIRNQHIDYQVTDLQIETGRKKPKLAHPTPAINRLRDGAALHNMGMMVPWGDALMFPRPEPRVMPAGPIPPRIDAAPFGNIFNHVHAEPVALRAPVVAHNAPIPDYRLNWLDPTGPAMANPYWPQADRPGGRVENDFGTAGLHHVFDHFPPGANPARRLDNPLAGNMGWPEMMGAWNFRNDNIFDGHQGGNDLVHDALAAGFEVWN